MGYRVNWLYTAGDRAVSLALLGLLVGGCAKKPAPPPPLPPLVTVAEAVGRDVSQYVDEIGRCAAVEVVSIRPQASGQITEIHFLEGQNVRKGDRLFTIDPRPYEAALHQAEAGVAQAKANLALAEHDLERGRSLVRQGGVSEEDYEHRQSVVEVDRAAMQAGQAAVETAQVNLSYCSIDSPCDGRTGEQLVNQGNVVTANSGTVLVVINKMDPIYADFTITERGLPEVRRRMAEGTLRAQVAVPDDPHAQPRLGELTFMDNTVQDSAGTVKLRVTLPNPDRLFWPGQFVRVRLILSIQKNAVLVPVEATQISQQGAFVFVVTGENKAELRLVKLGQRQGDQVVITEGLQAGERVVTTGQPGVAPGGPVRRIQPPGATAPSSMPVSTSPAAAIAAAPEFVPPTSDQAASSPPSTQSAP